MTSAGRHRTVLHVAPSFHSPTGVTPAQLAAWAPPGSVALFRGHDVGRRADDLRERAAASALVHWHANLDHFPPLAEEAARLRGRITQVATVHHVEPGEEGKVRALADLVDVVHVPAVQVRDVVLALDPGLPVVVLPYLVDGWEHVRAARPPRGDGFVVGWCGSAPDPSGRKRLDVLVDGLVRARREVPGLRLVVQGHVPASVQQRAAAGGLPVEVRRWTIDRTWRDDLYDGIDLYVSPSAVEGGPLPVFEAAARRCPVALTPTGLGAELLDAGGGLALGPDDVDGLAEVLVGAARLSPAERSDLADRTWVAARALAGPPAVDRYLRAARELAPEVGGRPHGATADRVARWNRSELALDDVEQVLDALRRGSSGGLAALVRARPWRLPAGAWPRVAVESGRAARQGRRNRVSR